MIGAKSWAAHNGTQVQLLFVARRLAHGVAEDDLVGTQVTQAFRTMCGALAEAVASVSGAAPATNEKQLLVSVAMANVHIICGIHHDISRAQQLTCRMQYKVSHRLLLQQALLVKAN